MPESTKSQRKKGKDGEVAVTNPTPGVDGDTNRKEGENGAILPPEEPKKPRYFPPRRIPNPFESAA